MEEDYLLEHWLFNKSYNNKQPIKWIKKDCKGNKQVWYSEDVLINILGCINRYLNMPYQITHVVPLVNLQREISEVLNG